MATSNSPFSITKPQHNSPATAAPSKTKPQDRLRKALALARPEMAEDAFWVLSSQTWSDQQKVAEALQRLSHVDGETSLRQILGLSQAEFVQVMGSYRAVAKGDQCAYLFLADLVQWITGTTTAQYQGTGSEAIKAINIGAAWQAALIMIGVGPDPRDYCGESLSVSAPALAKLFDVLDVPYTPVSGVTLDASVTDE